MTIITHTVVGEGSSALVVPDGSPTYTELSEEKDRLLKTILGLQDRLREAESNAQSNWEVVEDIACGAKLECLICGKSKPCSCDHA